MLIPCFTEGTMYVLLIAILFLISCVGFVLFLRKKTDHPSDENQVATLLRYMPEGYIGLDAHGVIREVNETYLTMTGYKKSDLIGKSLDILFSPTRKETLVSQLKTVEMQKSVLMETEHRCKGGAFLPFEVSVTSLGEKSPAFMCFYRDISLRKQSELSQKYYTDLLRYVIEHTKSAIAIHDKDLNYLYVSQKYLDEYGLKDAASIIGRHHYEVLPDLPQKWRDVHKRALAGEVVSAEDDPYVRADGNVEYTRWECRPWYSQEGAIGGIIIYTEMITKQKNIENELREAKNYLEALLTHANAPIVVWDAAFTITLANQSFASMFEQHVNEVLGKKLTEYAKHIPEEFRIDLFRQLDENLEITSSELAMLQKDGSIKTYLWNASPIFNPTSGELVATIAQGQDITQRKQIEQENAQQLAQLKRWYAVMTHREDRIMELKREVNALLKKEGTPIRYAAVEESPNA
ncbi:putative PAS/PAC sensor protein [Sphaerochaeta globosa str. Buddy]|uniref:Putative PAS/PAC sensor protein n=2 Tax=Sphaerochaeta TaxID=399320 RepID=F0RZ63_SPHGB|nr:putative PAS/PAC sensor protein [Sphaerochaeta globosa str. Buddy]